MDQAEKLFENPIVRMAGALSLLLVALRGLVGLLFGTSNLLGLFERLLFDRLWNTTQGEWLAIVAVLGGWIVLGSMIKLDTTFLGIVAGGFVFLTVVMDNVRGNLPDFLDNLYGLLPSALLLLAAAAGLVTVLKSTSGDFDVAGLYGKATSNLGLGGGAPVPAPAPAPAPAATPTPAPTATPAAGQEAGWLPDPKGEAELRYWDGSNWTDHTHNG